jgi:drug/metabolite transporter (DMT)-like permease
MKLAAALGLVYVVWGSTYLAIAVADRTLPPLLTLSVRFLLAGAILYAWAARRGAERPGLREWRAAATVAVLLLVIQTGTVALAEKHVPTGLAALIVASVPLFMAMIDRALFGVRIPLLAGAGILAGLAGVGLLVGGGSGSVDPLWALILIGGAFVWAAGSAYARVAPLPGNTALSAGMQMLTASVMLAVLGVSTGEAGRVHLSAVSPASAGSLVFLVSFGAVGVYTAYSWLLKNAPTPLLSTYAYVNPVIAVGLGWALAGEQLGARELVAGLVVLASVALILLARQPARAPEPKPIRAAARATVGA